MPLKYPQTVISNPYPTAKCWENYDSIIVGHCSFQPSSGWVALSSLVRLFVSPAMVIFLLIHHFLLVYLIDPRHILLHPHPPCHQYHPRNPYFPTLQSVFSYSSIWDEHDCHSLIFAFSFAIAPGRVQRTVATVVGNLQLAKFLNVFLRRTQQRRFSNKNQMFCLGRKSIETVNKEIND